MLTSVKTVKKASHAAISITPKTNDNPWRGYEKEIHQKTGTPPAG